MLTFERINNTILKLNFDQDFKQIKLIKYETVDNEFFHRCIYNFESTFSQNSILLNIHNENIEINIVILKVDSQNLHFFTQLFLTPINKENKIDDTTYEVDTNNKIDDTAYEVEANEKIEMFEKMGENVVNMFKVQTEQTKTRIKNENELKIKFKKKNGN